MYQYTRHGDRPSLLTVSFLTLQECGYCFKVKGVEYKMYGAIAVGLGNTPGLNKFGGFKEGVARALRICRHCMATLPDLVNKVMVTAE